MKIFYGIGNLIRMIATWKASSWFVSLIIAIIIIGIISVIIAGIIAGIAEEYSAIPDFDEIFPISFIIIAVLLLIIFLIL